MAEIRNYFWLPGIKHLRSEPSVHLLVYRKGRLVGRGRGLAFWFPTLGTSIAEIPVDDRDLSFLIHDRSRDYQPVTVQGLISYRVADAELLGQRVDFSLDLEQGGYLREPLDQLAGLFTGLVQQYVSKHVAHTPVRRLLSEGPDAIQGPIENGLQATPVLREMGLEIVSVRVLMVSPTAELEKALQTPTREALQQEADEASFARRALAVEKERAIAENELQNRIELAVREEELIQQQGQNEQHRVREQAEAQRIEAEADATQTRIESEAKAVSVGLEAEAEAGRINLVETAQVEGERQRMEIYGALPTGVLMALAAREMAGKFKGIEHLNITPELLGPVLTEFLQTGTKRLAREGTGGAQ